MQIEPLLPLSAFVSFFFIFRDKFKLPYRQSFLRASLFWALLVSVGTEGLSYFHKLNFTSLSLFWGLILVCSLFFLDFRKFSTFKFKKIQTVPWIWVFSLGTILVITGFIAIWSPPTTWDSMTYHMARVEHWIWQSSVEAYRTGTDRQICLSPWAEFAILHFQILLGNSDRFANLIQWFSFLGTLISVSLIVEILGGQRRTQAFAALLFATVPMAILQASSTQNDLVCAFFVSSAVYLCVRAIQNKSLSDFTFLSLAVALAIGTKGTAFIFLPPFLLWLGFELLRQKAFKKIFQLGALGIVFLLLINTAPWARNFKIWNNFFGPPPMFEFIDNQEHSLKALSSNMIKNMALHCLIPNSRYKDFLTRQITWFHNSVLHFDVSSQKTTMTKDFELKSLLMHEDYAGNPVHFLLFSFSLVLIFFFSKKGKRILLKKYTVCSILSFAIFCFLLKWQPWHSRLHTPLFALASVSIAMAFESLIGKRWQLIVGCLFISSLPWLFLNNSRPLITIQSKGLYSILKVPRIAQYFVERPYLSWPYVEVIDQVKKTNCKFIGIKLKDDGWEYPLWMIAKDQSVDVAFLHIDVASAFSMLKNPMEDDICGYIVIEQQDSWQPVEDSLKSMKLIWESKPIRFYAR